MLKHGESIVDMMGGEIDRIEIKLRVRFTMNFEIFNFFTFFFVEKPSRNPTLRFRNFIRSIIKHE